MKVHLRRKIANRIYLGHPWIFANEVEKIEGEPAPGDIVDVFYGDGKFCGKGYFNQQSQIIVRLLTRNKNEVVNEEFFINRIRKCWAYRQKIGYSENCRLVFGE